MSKYSLSFKLSVVTSYVEGLVGSKSIADRFGIDHSTVRKWVALHGAHGIGGLEQKYSCYDAAFKLGVLRRMWEDGLSLRQAAALFDIRSAGCLSVWEKQYERGGLHALVPRRKGRPPGMKTPEPPPGRNDPSADATKSRQELVAELNFLRMENAYLKKLEALTRQTAPKKRKPLPR